MLERLERSDRPAELPALLHVGEQVVERALRRAEHESGEDQPLDVQPGHQLHPGLVLLAEQPRRVDVAVGEEDVVDDLPAHRLDRPDLHALGVARDAEHGQALVLVAAVARAADEQHVVGEVRLGDPRLLAVDDVAAVAPLRLAAERADVGAGLRLGHRDRLDAAAHDAAEDLLLLLGGPEALEGARDDHAHPERPNRGHAARGLLEEQAQVDHPAARAAVLLRDRDAEPAELGHLGVELLVVRVAAALGEGVTLLARPALATAEVAQRGGELVLLRCQRQGHRAMVASGSHTRSWWRHRRQRRACGPATTHARGARVRIPRC